MSEQESTFWSPTIPNDNKQIWRYRDFTQFLSILERESLWFSRSNLFSDPFEGSFTRANVETRELRYKETEIPEDILESLSTIAKKFRQCSYLNCWHINEHESAAMWDLYLPADKGIAIQSTVGRFRNAINEPDNDAIIEEDSDEEEKQEQTRIMKIGNVRYIDYSSDMIPEDNTFAPLYHKRQSYEHEQEFRAGFSRFGDMLELKNGVAPESDFTTASGRNVKIDVNELIDSVRIAPSAPDWFSDLVSSVVDRYDVDIDIEKSDLDEDPVF
jgi:hypothetical protein